MSHHASITLGGVPEFPALIAPPNAEALTEAIRSSVGANAVYSLSYDLAALNAIHDREIPAINDINLVETVLAGETYKTEGSTFVPLFDRDLPVLVARYDSENAVNTEADSAQRLSQRHLLGMLYDHHTESFDVLQLARRRMEMSPAAQLQWDQLPLQAATLGDYRVAATIEPAHQVAGDLYDFALSPDGVTTVYCMDAMGHGQTATLSAALALAAARTARRSGASLVEQMTMADEAVAREYDGSRFVTMIALEFRADGIFAVNAGHEPMRRITATQAVSVEIHADPPLGIDSPKSMKLTALPPLEQGEALCLLTDGVREARSPGGAQYGYEATDAALVAGWSSAPLLMAHRLTRSVLSHVSADLIDDVTTVVVQRAATP